MIIEAKLQLSSQYVCYQKAGPDHAPVVLLLHGFGTRASFWQPVMLALAGEGFQVYALDLPGFGGSDSHPKRFTADSVGNLIASFVKQLGLGPVIVVGHSMGGAIAGGFAIVDPARIKALVLVDAFGYSQNLIPLSPGILFHLTLPALYYRLTWQPDKLIKSIIQSNFHDPERLDIEIIEMAIAEKWMDNIIERAKIAYGLGISIGFQFQRSAFVSKLRECYLQYGFPILVIWGQEDALVPASSAYQIKSEIPEIELQIFPDCGHAPSLEKTEDFNQRLTEFLSTLP